MSETRWKLLECGGERDEKNNLDHITFALQSGGQVYALTLSGQAGMPAGTVLNALRAAAAHYAAACGVSLEGARQVNPHEPETPFPAPTTRQ